MGEEELYIGTAESEHVEMYLKAIGKQMIRNTRLLEVLMRDSLKIDIDEEMVCGIEHHMKQIFTDALCTLLKHPRKCPHDHRIPLGKCCR